MKRSPFILVSICFIAGIFAARWGIPGSLTQALGTLSVFVLSMILFRFKWISTCCLSLLLVLSGLIYAQQKQIYLPDNISKFPYYLRKKISALEGIVVSDVNYKPYFKTQKTSFTLEIERIRINESYYPASGKVLVNIFRPVSVEYGNKILVEGKIHSPFVNKEKEIFSYRDYLRNRGIEFIFSVKKTGALAILSENKANYIRSLSLKFRQRIKSVLEQYLSQNEAGIMKAIIIGERSYVPKHVKELFLRTGTAHVLAISGLHIGAVSLLILLILRFLPVSKAAVNMMTIVLLCFYLFLTGGRPSVFRAVIMISVLLLGEVLEKESNSLNNLALAAFLILLLNPFNVFDIGFQLSFACVLSILLLAPKVRKVVLGKKTSSMCSRLADTFIYSASIWCGVAGLIMLYFQILTPVSILANFVVIPLISVIVFLGFGLVLSGLYLPVLAPALAQSVQLSLNTMVASIFLFDKLPFSYFTFSYVSSWYVLVYYIILAFVFVCLCKIDKPTQV